MGKLALLILIFELLEKTQLAPVVPHKGVCAEILSRKIGMM